VIIRLFLFALPVAGEAYKIAALGTGGFMTVTSIDKIRNQAGAQILVGAFARASVARRNTYSPYSKFAVGAAIVLHNGEEFAGCNVENAAYGSTVCAERAAILGARSVSTKVVSGSIAVVFIVTDTGDDPACPCGACRGVIAEFGSESTKVYASNLDGSVIWEFTMGELLPYSFEMRSGAQVLAAAAKSA
jgi:cytidine deaminase